MLISKPSGPKSAKNLIQKALQAKAQHAGSDNNNSCYKNGKSGVQIWRGRPRKDHGSNLKSPIALLTEAIVCEVMIVFSTTNCPTSQKKRARGQGLAEYMLIVGLIAVVAIASLTTLGGTLTDQMTFIADKITGAINTVTGSGSGATSNTSTAIGNPALPGGNTVAVANPPGNSTPQGSEATAGNEGNTDPSAVQPDTNSPAQSPETTTNPSTDTTPASTQQSTSSAPSEPASSGNTASGNTTSSSGGSQVSQPSTSSPSTSSPSTSSTSTSSASPSTTPSTTTSSGSTASNPQTTPEPSTVSWSTGGANVESVNGCGVGQVSCASPNQWGW